MTGCQMLPAPIMPTTRNEPYIPMSEARGFTVRFDNFSSV